MKATDKVVSFNPPAVPGHEGPAPESIKDVAKFVLFENTADILTALQESPESAKSVLDNINAAIESAAVLKTRQALKLKFEGPGKAIAKVIKSTMDMFAAVGNPFKDEASAIAFLKDKGMLPSV